MEVDEINRIVDTADAMMRKLNYRIIYLQRQVAELENRIARMEGNDE